MGGLFWCRPTLKKAFFYMRFRNLTPCPFRGQIILHQGGIGGTVAQLDTGGIC